LSCPQLAAQGPVLLDSNRHIQGKTSENCSKKRLQFRGARHLGKRGNFQDFLIVAHPGLMCTERSLGGELSRVNPLHACTPLCVCAWHINIKHAHRNPHRFDSYNPHPLGKGVLRRDSPYPFYTLLIRTSTYQLAHHSIVNPTAHGALSSKKYVVRQPPPKEGLDR